MASVYKRKRDRGRKGASWYIAYVDEAGIRRTVKGCPDRTATEALARKLESEAELRRRGVIDPKADAYAWHESRPLADHLADYRAHLIAKGDTAKHTDLTRCRVARLVAIVRGERPADIETRGAGIESRHKAETILDAHLAVARLADLTADRVQAALATLRDDGRSLETLNAHLRAAKGFARWLWRVAGRVREDGLAPLSLYNAATDRRHDRRALSEAEASALIAAAEAGSASEGMAGPDRAMLYRVALGTGFRANELRSLTPESFDIDGDPPTATVAAAYSKRRRADAQPISPALAAALRPWLAGLPVGVPVFRLPPVHTARMLRSDLAAAGIPYRDGSGRVADFHALRATYITQIVRGGASVKTAQTLARHASPVLTIGRYAQAALHDVAGALDALPDLSRRPDGPEAAALRPTGTDPAGGTRLSQSGSALTARTGRDGVAGGGMPPRRGIVASL